MVSLRLDSRGNFIARKRLPDDVREEYGKLYGARFEAKFSARASLGKQSAQQKFHELAGATLQTFVIGSELHSKLCKSRSELGSF